MINLNFKDLQLQYEGYTNTQQLWQPNQSILGLKQINLEPTTVKTYSTNITHQLRLGKLVERFVSETLKQQTNINILAENVQIQDNKTTIGEIDCIITQNNIPIHLEIIYKFYLYLDTNNGDEIDKWIGPNKNDNLRKKLTKLKDKQLPLIYNKHSDKLIKKLGLNTHLIKQHVYFKAQLFTPYQEEKNITFNNINKACLSGFYVAINKIETLKLCKFYIPSKLNWLKAVSTNINWITFDVFKATVTEITNNKTAPLCWVKYPNGVLNKFFVVWW